MGGASGARTGGERIRNPQLLRVLTIDLGQCPPEQIGPDHILRRVIPGYLWLVDVILLIWRGRNPTVVRAFEKLELLSWNWGLVPYVQRALGSIIYCVDPSFCVRPQVSGLQRFNILEKFVEDVRTFLCSQSQAGRKECRHVTTTAGNARRASSLAGGR